MDKETAFPASRPVRRRCHRRLALAAAALALAALAPQTAAADMLSGGLLGSLLRGDPFTGPRVFDLLVIGLAIFLVLRLILGRQKPGNRADDPATPRDGQAPPPREASPPDPGSPPGPGTPPGSGAPRPKPDMYSNAAATWAYLQSAPSKDGPATPPAAPGSDAEFLAGAKLAYSRIVAAIAKRDFDDLASFVTPELLAKLRQSLPASPPPEPDILLVEAKLADKRQEDRRTVMVVDYDVLIHEENAPHNTDRFERWRFSRDEADQAATWLLEDREQRR
ncbi:MAG: hypothetical protein ACP59X_08210 [Solidesulfovibrio sp. DCME]|uniref:hypothetical protein n=1 Tax=Solidesulfovibrio sp. DCME TaxID=3447380 RepID=UPI003D0FE5DF